MKPTQELNDGVVTIFAVTNLSAPGAAPVEGLTPKQSLCFKRRTIGINRYYAAMQANAKVDMLIRCPYVSSVSTQDVAAINGVAEQYLITLIQTIENSAPPMMDLTLERLEANYDLP